MRRSENPFLVVRRGEEFKLRITLKEPYNKDRDNITFLFKCRGKAFVVTSSGTCLIGVCFVQTEGLQIIPKAL